MIAAVCIADAVSKKVNIIFCTHRHSDRSRAFVVSRLLVIPTEGTMESCRIGGIFFSRFAEGESKS